MIFLIFGILPEVTPARSALSKDPYTPLRISTTARSGTVGNQGKAYGMHSPSAISEPHHESRGTSTPPKGRPVLGLILTIRERKLIRIIDVHIAQQM